MAEFDVSQLPADRFETYRPSLSATTPLFNDGASTDRPPDATASMAEPEDGVNQTRPMLSGEVRKVEEHGYDKPKYRLQRRIGQGGFGEVWQAEQCNLQRRVAVKRLRNLDKVDASTASMLLQGFRHEAFASAALDHPNIVPVHELIDDGDNELALCMKLVNGRPWDRLMSEDYDVLPWDDYLVRHLNILLDVAQALAFAHSRGIVHRDIKPGQVMTGSFGETLLMDWGLALRVPAGTEIDAEVWVSPEIPTTDSGSNPAGTPAYMAPEQTDRDCRRIGPWTDVYLLGGCLFKIITGQPPHVYETAKECFYHAAHTDVALPLDQDLPPELLELLAGALDRDVDARIPNAEEFRRRLADFLNGATKRRESMAVLSGVKAKRAAAGERTYGEYAAMLGDLGRAQLLWPGNDELEPEREACLRDYAQLALLHGDLLLARTQAEQLGGDPEREALLAQVARSILMRRSIAVAAVSLLVVMLIGAVLFSWRLSTERNIAQQARNDAEEAREVAVGARNRAERSLRAARVQAAGSSGLVDFMLSQLRVALDKELRPGIGLTADARNELLHGIAGRMIAPVQQYYEELDMEGWPDELREEQAARMVDSAQLFLKLDRHAEALELLDRADPIIRETSGAQSALMGRSLQTRGGALYATGDYQAAETAYRSGLALNRAELGEDDDEVISGMTNLALVMQDAGRLDESESLVREALAKLDRRGGDMHKHYGPALGVLGTLQYTRGDLEGAEATFRRALELRKKALEQRGEEDPEAAGEIATAMNSWSVTLLQLGRLDEAEAVTREALAASEHIRGPESLDVSIVLNTLSTILQRRGQFDDALPYAERALAITQAELGAEHAYVGIGRNNLAVLYDDLGRQGDALREMSEGARILEASLGPDHPSVAQVLVALGMMHERTGDLDGAEAAMQRALAMRLKNFEPSHRLVRAVQRQLFEVQLAIALRDESQERGSGRAAAARANATIEPMSASARKFPPLAKDYVVTLYLEGREAEAAEVAREFTRAVTYPLWPR